MNGYCDFIYTPHGWRCIAAYQFKVVCMLRRVSRWHRRFAHNMLRIEGEFLSLPKPGQFVRHPHKYIDWSKS